MAGLQSLRGERFEVDLDDGPEEGETPTMVKDVLERPTPAGATQPCLPAFKAQPGGFPKHKNRLQQSRFKAQKAATGAGQGQAHISPLSAVQDQLPKASLDAEIGDDERTAIDRENLQRIQQMSDDEIAKEQRELMESLDPSVLQFLSQRSASSADKRDISKAPSNARESSEISENAARKPGEAISAETFPPGVHFPKPPQLRDLDDTSESFLDDLHEKYFPFLPAEPEKLAWMKQTGDSTYSPNQDTVHLSSIRFDFRGSIVPPRSAANLPVTMGLHHHGDAPESAGYTITELAQLARSTVPMQRCMAFQTLGRILYRLGTGDFGARDERVPEALRQIVGECRVVETLQEEASRANGHLSAKTYATEALWLWHRAGGREFRAA